MISAKAIHELYEYLKTLDEPHMAKHSVSAIILCLLEDLEQSGNPITPEAIEAAFKTEMPGLNYLRKRKKLLSLTESFQAIIFAFVLRRFTLSDFIHRQ